MKKIILLGAAAVALVATPTLAQQAQGGFERGAGVTRAQVETRVRDMFARVDTNRDGYVTQAEAQVVAGATAGSRKAQRAERREARGDRKEQRFASLDANRDGSISRAEFFAKRERGDRAERKALRAERRAERMERRGERGANRGLRFGARAFERMDSNRDSRISLAEATELRMRAFERADANRDGRVTRDERRAVRAARQDRRG